MGTDNARSQRGRRIRAVGSRWRKADQAARDAAPSDPSTGNTERRTESLGSLDRLRREAPEDDLETRRAADEIEREIERSRRQPE
jgi:hypothetical protein